DAYNRLLGENLGLLPMKIKGAVTKSAKDPMLINRDSFSLPSFMKFKTDEYYKDFNRVEVFKALELEEVGAASQAASMSPDRPAGSNDGDATNPPVVALRLQNGLPALVSKKIDAGEVMLLATAVDREGKDDSAAPTWTDWPLHFVFVPFIDVAVAHLLHGQTQNHNLTAGETLRWHPSEQTVRSFTLVRPDRGATRLRLPAKIGIRTLVTANELTEAGVYWLVAGVPGETSAVAEDKNTGVPLGVTPDLRESEDLASYSDEQLDARLGFTPIHLTAGADAP